jgi:hypothetical protein
MGLPLSEDEEEVWCLYFVYSMSYFPSLTSSVYFIFVHTVKENG